MSQETPEGDRQGVIEGFANMGTDIGRAVSNIVKERADLKT